MTDGFRRGQKFNSLVFVLFSLFHLESLVRLNASFNNFLMAELPDLFSSLVSLKELLLQNCSLKILPPR